MLKSFDHQFMKDNCGCYDESELMGCSFMGSPDVTIDSILDSEIRLKDKYWFVCKKLLTKEQNQKLAIGVASIVLEIYEKKYPGDDRPRKAIQAAKDYLSGTIGLDELKTARDAAAAAADAAAAAAAAAADAAYADADAAYADADAAYADAAAAAYADAAAADAADAAYAAADAAYADAADAAYAAADAYAAYGAYGAYAAAYAAADAFQNTLLQYLKDFCKEIPESVELI